MGILQPHGENVDWAINLVEFDPNHSYIVNHHLARVSGGESGGKGREGSDLSLIQVLVCDTKEAATLLCYNK